MMTRRTGLVGLAGLGLVLLSGCQGFVPEAGLTLPSPFYLKHAPQYLPPSEPYPLQKELDSQNAAQQQYNEAQRPFAP